MIVVRVSTDVFISVNPPLASTPACLTNATASFVDLPAEIALYVASAKSLCDCPVSSDNPLSCLLRALIGTPVFFEVSAIVDNLAKCFSKSLAALALATPIPTIGAETFLVSDAPKLAIILDDRVISLPIRLIVLLEASIFLVRLLSGCVNLSFKANTASIFLSAIACASFYYVMFNLINKSFQDLHSLHLSLLDTVPEKL